MIEPGIYKDVMSSFPSGVTVVTTLDPDGGIRINRQRTEGAGGDADDAAVRVQGGDHRDPGREK